MREFGRFSNNERFHKLTDFFFFFSVEVLCVFPDLCFKIVCNLAAIDLPFQGTTVCLLVDSIGSPCH